MEASSAHAKAYLLMGGRFAGATATGTVSSVLIVQLRRAAGGDRLARIVSPSLDCVPDYCSTAGPAVVRISSLQTCFR
jgi:hypothetical protein